MIRFYDPEAGGLTRWGRLGLFGTTLGSLSLASCGGETGTQAQDTVESSGNPEGTAVVLQWPGKIALRAECPSWSHNNRGPYTLRDTSDGKKEQLLVTIDARLSTPRICDPEEDRGAGAQRGASASSGAVQLPNNPDRYKGNFIKNGTVVKVLSFTNHGELTCQSDGTGQTQTWIKAQAAPEGPTAWMPIASVTYLPTSKLLAQAGIPEDPAQRQYAQSAQGGC